MHIGLLRVLRMVIRADSDPARQALFANLMQARPLVRLVFGLHERIEGTIASAWLIAGYGLALLLAWLRFKVDGVGTGAFILSFLCGQAIVAALAWGRIARLYGMADLAADRLARN